MKKQKSTLCAFACGLILFILAFIWQGKTDLSDIKSIIRIFSNAALVPGIMLTGIACLARISEENLFDGVKYALSSMLSHLRREPKPYTDYYAYIHREKKKGTVFSLLFPGCFFLAAAIILTIAFYFC